MRPRHAVLPSLSIASRLSKLLSCKLIAPESPLFTRFVFNRLHTLSSSLSRKSLACPCYENGRKSFGFITPLPQWHLISMLGRAGAHAVSRENSWGECQQFPFRNSPFVATVAILVLSFHALTNCPFCKPFVLIFIHVMGGCTPPAWFCPLLSRPLHRYSLFPIPYPLSFQTLAHSFALFCAQAKLKSFLFMPFRTLCEKHPGGG
jgi:hypothetical protein